MKVAIVLIIAWNVVITGYCVHIHDGMTQLVKNSESVSRILRAHTEAIVKTAGVMEIVAKRVKKLEKQVGLS